MLCYLIIEGTAKQKRNRIMSGMPCLSLIVAPGRSRGQATFARADCRAGRRGLTASRWTGEPSS